MCNFLPEMPTFPPAKKLIFGRKRFGKRTLDNLQTGIYFQKKSHDQVDKIIDQFYLSKCIPNISLKFISCQEFCKEYVVIRNCNVRMRRCFKFQI